MTHFTFHKSTTKQSNGNLWYWPVVLASRKVSAHMHLCFDKSYFKFGLPEQRLKNRSAKEKRVNWLLEMTPCWLEMLTQDFESEVIIPGTPLLVVYLVLYSKNQISALSPSALLHHWKWWLPAFDVSDSWSWKSSAHFLRSYQSDMLAAWLKL